MGLSQEAWERGLWGFVPDRCQNICHASVLGGTEEKIRPLNSPKPVPLWG
jgi:hypothetical protein